MLILPVQSHANITPTDVFQKTEIFRLKLDNLDLLDHDAIEEQDVHVLRHPRHVIQKVRECDTLLAKILTQHEKRSAPLPDLFSVKEIRPSDVLAGVEHLLSEVEKLGDVDVDAPKFAGEKLPSDVYKNLQTTCRALKTKIVPSDVFQMAEAVNERLRTIFSLRGYEASIAFEHFQDKNPADVYIKTLDLLYDLRQLAYNPDFAIPGGVVFSQYRPLEEDVRPQNVISLVNDAFAETNAIAYTLGYRDHVVLPAYKEGKTSSDVFSQIHHAHEMVKFLIEKEGYE